MKNRDIVIIGGGITGLATAYYLVKSGIKNISILEKSYLGSGSTGRCGSGIRQQFTTKEHIVLMKESVKLWKKWNNDLPIPIHFEQGGYLWLLINKKELAQYKEYVKYQNTFGVESTIISTKEAKEIVPDLNTDDVVGASWCHTDGSAYPFDVINALQIFLKERKVEINTFEEVNEIHAKNDKIQEVVTNKNRYTTNTVINGAGYGAKYIGQLVGLNLPLQPYRHQIAASEPLRNFLGPMVVKDELYFLQTHRGRIIGGTDLKEPPLSNLNSTLNFLEEYSKQIISVLPILSSVNIMKQWAGYYIVTPDRHPILGPTKINGFILGCGYSGHGFMLGPVVGKLLASLIVHKNMYIREANNLTLERFKTGKLIQERAVIG